MKSKPLHLFCLIMNKAESEHKNRKCKDKAKTIDFQFHIGAELDLNWSCYYPTSETKENKN